MDAIAIAMMVIPAVLVLFSLSLTVTSFVFASRFQKYTLPDEAGDTLDSSGYAKSGTRSTRPRT